MAATIKDIAELTGLSVGTVSRYLNGYRLKEKNEVKISKAIKELNFRINGYARFLKTKKSKMIGLIIPSIQLTFASEIVNILEQIFSKHGYSLMITIIPNSSQNSLDKLLNLEIYNPEGLIIIPPADNKGMTDWLKKIGKSIPTIIIDRVLPDFKDTYYVLVNNETASQKAVQYFIRNGHKKISIITGDEGGYTTIKRTKGYINALNTEGISNKKIISSDYTKKGGYESVNKLMKSNNKPTAIFTTNYDMTLGALQYFKDHNIYVGEDISLIGFDLDVINEIFPKKIAMVLQPINEMATHTANQMMKAIYSQDLLKGNVIFDCSYVKGETIKKV